MKKAYKELYLEAMNNIEEQKRLISNTLDKLNGIASNNVMLRDKVNRYRVISFMLGMGLLAQYCLFRFY